MYIYLHIPKTAGTALSTIMDFGSNRRIMYDYECLTSLSMLNDSYEQYRLNLEKKKREKILNHKEFIEENFDFIYGHFFSSLYDGIFDNSKYLTCVRKPINRVISHINHLLDEGDIASDLYNEINSGNLTLPELASFEYVGNLQSKMLNSRSIKDFDHVFISEKLAESVYQFQLIHSFERNDEYMNLPGAESIPKSNVIQSKMGKRINFSSEEIKKTESLLVEDNELYNKALEKFDSQARLSSKIIIG